MQLVRPLLFSLMAFWTAHTVVLPVPKTDAPPKIQLPSLETPLGDDEVYPLDFEGDVMVDAFPAGLVNITRKEAVKEYEVRAKWADTGKTEWRTFKKPVFIERVPEASGTVTVVVVPVGVKSVTEWKSAQLKIGGGGPAPPPVASLKTDVVRAYAADKATNKAELLTYLAGVWREASNKDFLAGYQTGTTWAAVFADVSKVSAKKLGQTDLQGVRLVIAKFLDSRLPTDRQSALDKTLAASTFGAVADALEAAAKTP